MDSKPEHFPSFYKPLIGNYAEKLRIPPVFEAMFDVTLPENVMIKAKRGESKWDVKIEQYSEDKFFSGDGWGVLVTDNDLKHGDILLFRLLSNNVFDFVPYGPNGCEKVVLDPILRNAGTRGVDFEASDENEHRLTVPPPRGSPPNQNLSQAGHLLSDNRHLFGGPDSDQVRD